MERAELAGDGLCVAAVVVAYNSTVAVERCLHSLAAQTVPVGAVLLIDNSEPTPLSFDLPAGLGERVRVLVAGENLGPAGGFALGLAHFAEDASLTHAWLMDDDAYPDPDCLELLLAEASGSRAGVALFPSAVYEKTGQVMNFPGWSGVLLDRIAVRLAGLPLPELFWWAEDTEYLQFRLPRKGVQVRRVDRARVVYDLIRRVGGRPAWKYYYEVRNMIWFRVAVQRGTELWKLPRSVVGLLVSAATSREEPLRKLRFWGRGVAHGFLGRLGAEVRPPNPPRTDGDG